MNLGHVARLLSGFVLFFTLPLAIPLGVSVSEGSQTATTVPFAGSMAVGLTIAALLWFAGRKSRKDFFRKEGLAMVGLAWFLAAAIAAMPFVWSGAIPSVVDAYFEAVSGLTTTGATVLGGSNAKVESLPQSVLLWRAMLQWMGGMGIILVFVILLPGVGVTGSRLLSTEQVGLSDKTVRPRMAGQARRLFTLYIGLTSIAVGCYWVAGLPVFDAVCHSLTTLATGGFSTNSLSIGGYENLAVELVAVVFMFIGGCNFLLILGVLARGGRASSSTLVQRTEFRVYLGLTVLVTLGVTLSLWFSGQTLTGQAPHDYTSFGRCLRDAVFQTVSLLTGTGYCNANYQQWPAIALLLVFMCMLIGGCTGSTAGGFKVLRVVICAKLASHALRSFVRPRMVEKLKVAEDVIPDRVVSAVLGLMVLWIGLIAAGTLVLGMDPRLDLVSAFTASVSMMGCIGPAFGQVSPVAEGVVGSVDLGPHGGYGDLYPGAKMFMSLQMVLGRLEILAPLALLTPKFWKD